MVRKWLITGGCGFIGRNLIRHIKTNSPNDSVRILDNLSVGTKQDLASITEFIEYTCDNIKDPPNAIELIEGDIRDFNACLSCCKGIDVVVHLAANTGVAPSVENPRLDMETNIIGTFNMLEASRLNQVKSFIFASSGAPVGEVEPPITEDKAPRPVSPYGASKLAGEGYCSAYFRTFGVKTIALRFSNVYGPLSHRKNSVIARFIKNALANKPLEIYGDGMQTRDFLYINDLVNAIMLSATSNIGGEVFQISSERETKIIDVAIMIQEIFKNKLGVDIKIDHKPSRLGDVIRNYADNSKARRLLGYKPMHKLKESIEITLDYFLSIKEKL